MMFRLQDKILIKMFNIDVENKFYKTRNSIEGIKDILTEMEVIDTKSSALLTHISIMFAVLSFLLAAPGGHAIVQLLLTLEFVAYLFIAMIVIRCIDTMGPPSRTLPEDDDELKKLFSAEIILRRTIYQRSVRGVYLLTALLIPIIIAKYIYVFVIRLMGGA